MSVVSARAGSVILDAQVLPPSGSDAEACLAAVATSLGEAEEGGGGGEGGGAALFAAALGAKLAAAAGEAGEAGGGAGLRVAVVNAPRVAATVAKGKSVADSALMRMKMEYEEKMRALRQMNAAKEAATKQLRGQRRCPNCPPPGSMERMELRVKMAEARLKARGGAPCGCAPDLDDLARDSMTSLATSLATSQRCAASPPPCVPSASHSHSHSRSS